MRPGTPGFSGARLREAREARGIAAVSLAELSGMSVQSIYAYESDRKSPGPEALQAISNTLRLPQTYFVRAPRETTTSTTYYRSLASATKTARRRADNRMAWVRDVVDYIADYVALPKVNLPEFDLPDDPLLISDEEIEGAADALRRHWRLGEAPIANVVSLLENQGFIVARGSLGAETLDGLSRFDRGRPFIYIGTDKGSAVRWRFDAAHELGHLVLHSHVSQEVFQNTNFNARIEKQAHRFASAFLLPLAPFGEDLFAVTLDVFRSLKPKWKTSIGMMIMRAEQGGYIDEHTKRSLWISMSRRKWRQSEPFDDVLEAEEPRVLRRAIELILENGEQTPDDISARLSLNFEDIESLCDLPPEFLRSFSRVGLIDSRPNVIELFGDRS